MPKKICKVLMMMMMAAKLGWARAGLGQEQGLGRNGRSRTRPGRSRAKQE